MLILHKKPEAGYPASGRVLRELPNFMLCRLALMPLTEFLPVGDLFVWFWVFRYGVIPGCDRPDRCRGFPDHGFLGDDDTPVFLPGEFVEDRVGDVPDDVAQPPDACLELFRPSGNFHKGVVGVFQLILSV